MTLDCNYSQDGYFYSCWGSHGRNGTIYCILMEIQIHTNTIGWICDSMLHTWQILLGIWYRELHGITDRGNPAVTVVKTAVKGTGCHFYRGNDGNGDSYLKISIDYRGKTAVTAVLGTSSVVLPR